MRPKPFTALLADHMAIHQPAGVTRVRSCDDIGSTQPFGLVLGLEGGWTVVVQCVAGSPPLGVVSVAPEDLPDEAAYAVAAGRFAAEQAAVKPVRTGRPPMVERDVLLLVWDAVRGLGHPDVAEVKACDGERRSVEVACADGFTLWLFVAGYLPPGATTFPHPIRGMPADWR